MIKTDVDLFKKYFFKKSGNLKLLFAKYDNFQNKIKIFNVVGSNGKGSLSYFLAKQLELNFKKVGLFTSPAFLYHNERIAINSKYISDLELNSYFKKYDCDFLKYQLNFFEIYTFIAARYFFDSKVDVAVIEAGIGGVKDATNEFLNQKGVILTSVCKDHQKILGDSIKSIILNKILIRKNQNTPLFIAQSNIKYQSYFKEFKNYYLDKKTNLKLNLDLFQKENVSLAILVCNFFNFRIKNSLFKNLKLKGRFQKINFLNQEIILDGGHNIGALKLLIKNLKLLANQEKIIILFATSKTKRFYKMKTYLKKFYKVYLTQFNHLKAYKVKNYEKTNFVKEKNWGYFLKKNKNKTIIVCGSIYFISCFYWFLLEYKKKNLKKLKPGFKNEKTL